MANRKTRFFTDDDNNQNNKNLSKEELYDIYSSFGEGTKKPQESNEPTQEKQFSGAKGFSTEKNTPMPEQKVTFKGFSVPSAQQPYEEQPRLSFDSDVDSNDQLSTSKKIIYVHKERATAKIYALAAVAVCIGVVAFAIITSINAIKNKDSINNNGVISAVSSEINADEYLEQLFGDDSRPPKQEEPESQAIESKPSSEDYASQIGNIAEPVKLLIVNEDNPLKSSYKPSTARVSLPTAKQSVRLETTANQALNLMYKAMKADKVASNLRVFSAYRSYATQKAAFKSLNKRMKNELGIKDTDVASNSAFQLLGSAGTSEQQLGTCIGRELGQDFLSTDAGKWLYENSYKFGFILRYPADKLNIHKRTYEPWHFRYVGATAAKYMKENNICLEEYVELFPQ